MIDQKALAIDEQSDDICIQYVSFQIFYRTGNIFSVE